MILNLAERAARVLAATTYRKELVAVRFKGSRFWDVEGRPYLDFATGPGVANIGWNHPKLTKALAEFILSDQAGPGGNEILNPWVITLAEKIISMLPGGEKVWDWDAVPDFKAFFSNSGGEAVEAANILSFIRRPERKSVLSFIDDFHGRMGLSRAATTSKPVHFLNIPHAVRLRELIFPGNNLTNRNLDFLRDPDKYLDYAEAQIGRFLDDIDLAVIELIQGEGGINVAYGDAIRALVMYLREHDIRICVDEVQHGFGRTGKFFAFEYYGIEPDIVTIAKAASGGLIPIGITVFKKELDFKKPREHSNTFGGNPQACFTALKVIEIIENERVLENVARMDKYLNQLLGDKILFERGPGTQLIKTWGGIGLMQRIGFANTEVRNAVVDEALKEQLFVMGAGEDVIRLMPPLTIADYELEEGVAKLFSAIKKVADRI